MHREHEEDIKKHNRSFLVPFLIGGLFGAALGILLAPRAGRETIRRIQGLAGDTGKKIGTTIDRGKLFYKDAKIAVSSAVEAGRQAYAEERNRVNGSEMDH